MKKGFTLIEFLVVLAIIGILTSIVADTINKNKQSHQKDSKTTETLK